MNKSSAITETTAIILAGGMGSRLNALRPGRQKVVLEVGSKPFLSYLLDQLRGAVAEVILCVGHFAEQVRDIFGNSYGELLLKYSEEQKPLGTAGALRLALPLIESETLLVMNGDSFCDIDLGHFYHWHIARHAQASIVLVSVSDSGRFGMVSINERSQITAFDEKGANFGPGLINAGIYLFKRDIIESLPLREPASLENEVFPRLVHGDFYGYCADSVKFVDIGTPSSLHEAQALLGCMP
jgi:NDP-sugar pyrophosphorylase family protein